MLTSEYLLYFMGISFFFVVIYGSGAHLIIKNIIKEVLDAF